MKDVATKSPRAAEATLVRIRSGNEVLELNYDGAICQHPGSLWWGTAVAFRAMQAAGLALSQDELWSRDSMCVVTGHPGPGVRDAVDYVANVVARGRYKVVLAEGCGMQCNSQMKYDWWVSDGRRTALVQLVKGFVPLSFYTLSDRLTPEQTTKEDLRLFRNFKVNLSARIWNARLEDSFKVTLLDKPLQPGELPAEIDEHYFDDALPAAE